MAVEPGVPQWALVLIVVPLILGAIRLARSNGPALRSQLKREVGRMPVYSAETTDAQEAEFIRDRLPKRWPTLLVVVVVAALIVVVASRATAQDPSRASIQSAKASISCVCGPCNCAVCARTCREMH